MRAPRPHCSKETSTRADVGRERTRIKLRKPIMPRAFWETSTSLSVVLFSKASSRMSAPRKSILFSRTPKLSIEWLFVSCSRKKTIGEILGPMLVTAAQCESESCFRLPLSLSFCPRCKKTPLSKQFQLRSSFSRLLLLTSSTMHCLVRSAWSSELLLAMPPPSPVSARFTSFKMGWLPMTWHRDSWHLTERGTPLRLSARKLLRPDFGFSRREIRPPTAFSWPIEGHFLRLKRARLVPTMEPPAPSSSAASWLVLPARKRNRSRRARSESLGFDSRSSSSMLPSICTLSPRAADCFNSSCFCSAISLSISHMAARSLSLRPFSAALRQLEWPVTNGRGRGTRPPDLQTVRYFSMGRLFLDLTWLWP
mmetsp:Transcript_51136/g.91869  ORF Transcript_51136/g.91869 Transcript_51136/m.91869 type:complete len:367 (+) Transcript_51136:2219-3319(+)